VCACCVFFFFFSSRRRHTRFDCDWSSDVCSSDLVAWMGHYDLTVSMGIPAQFEHPHFLEAMDALVACCRRHGVAPGFLPATPEAAAQWIGRGFRMISLGSDIGVFLNGMRSFRKSLVDRLVV